MSRRHLPAFFLGALAVILLLAGCATSGGPGTAAAPVAELKPATIIGSEETSTMFDNFTAYVLAIDGQVVTAGRSGWNQPLAIKAGPHRLTIAFIRGIFTAQTDVQISAQPEAVYQLKFATDAQLFGKNSYCEFWIEDAATKQKALEPRRVPLARVEKGIQK